MLLNDIKLEISQLMREVGLISHHSFQILRPQIMPPHAHPRGYSQKNLVRMCGPLPKTLTLFKTKIWDFPYPIYDLTKHLTPYLWPVTIGVTLCHNTAELELRLTDNVVFPAVHMADNKILCWVSTVLVVPGSHKDHHMTVTTGTVDLNIIYEGLLLMVLSLLMKK